MYIRVELGVPIKTTVEELKKANPNISFPAYLTPELLAEYGVYVVEPTEPPSYNPEIERLMEGEPQLNEENNKWYQTWEVELKPEELVSSEIRNKRNTLLRESDWTQLSNDSLLKAKWEQWREGLRNITEQEGFPYEVSWPVNPDHPDFVFKPTAVTMRQARLALLNQNLLTQVETALHSLESQGKEAALIEWEYSIHIERNSILVQSLSSTLGFSEEELDNLFTLAATL